MTATQTRSATVVALVGSLRSASVNRRLAEAAARVSPDGVRIDIYEGLADLPFYNEDIDLPGADLPEVVKFRQALGVADAILLVTPEYNGTLPAVLKNALDWASRPYGNGAVKGKSVAVISSSPSPRGATWANDDARKVVSVAGGQIVDEATLLVGEVFAKFADVHPAEHTETAEQLAGVVRALVGSAAESAAA